MKVCETSHTYYTLRLKEFQTSLPIHATSSKHFLGHAQVNIFHNIWNDFIFLEEESRGLCERCLDLIINHLSIPNARKIGQLRRGAHWRRSSPQFYGGYSLKESCKCRTMTQRHGRQQVVSPDRWNGDELSTHRRVQWTTLEITRAHNALISTWDQANIWGADLKSAINAAFT